MPSTNISYADSIASVTVILEHKFDRPELIKQALTHPSACGRNLIVSDSYERLEFLGDRVLGLVIADMLLHSFPKESEGSLAKRFTALVRREALALVAKKLGFDKLIVLAKGEEESGERENPALQADVCESLIGALYLDAGYDAALRFIQKNWKPLLNQDLSPPQDAKSTLQEWAQGRGLPLPTYKEVSRSGPPHAPLFNIQVSVKGLDPVIKQGNSKRKGEQEAAKELLRFISENGM
ncbi:ribonuclease [Kiloniella litopenaei]|uniref:Ribonuclease 3 n=1 Tax=Kiloniella litopenaei TaxID=1549748 RepID=A0A0M2R9W9_9PROT|nr:ribonuclease III [Kiloniella litopenaei]KKJ76785.1 ribonuclease [Kiloniella litopenaei]